MLGCALAVSSLLGQGLTAPAAQAAPTELPAVFATGGVGQYKDVIQWLQWGDYETQFKGNDRPDVPVLDRGQTRTFRNVRALGPGQSLHTVCTLSNLKHLGHGSKRDDGSPDQRPGIRAPGGHDPGYLGRRRAGQPVQRGRSLRAQA